MFAFEAFKFFRRLEWDANLKRLLLLKFEIKRAGSLGSWLYELFYKYRYGFILQNMGPVGRWEG